MNPVAEISATQGALESKRRLTRCLVDGTEAMRQAGKSYLPKHPAESEDAWKARKDASVLLPAYRDAINLTCGLIFRKAVGAADVPMDAQPWLDNVDLMGRSVTQFAEDILRDAFNGVSYIVADYPNTLALAQGMGRSALTLADERDLGIRPHLVHVLSEQVLGWRVQTVNGHQILTQFRYKECATEPDGAYGSKVVERIRVLEPGMVTVYTKTDAQTDWMLDPEQSGIVTIKEVPVVPIYTGRTGYMEGVPPLLDLAWKNVEHWQSASDQRNILHVARVPLLATIGIDANDLVIGPQNILALPVGGDAKWIEHSGKAIESGRIDLQDLEAQMQTMAGKILDRGVVKTATQSGIESTQAMSKIQAWALGLQAGLNAAWALCGKWINQDLGTLAVNSDVDISTPDAPFLTEIRNAVVAGLLTKETYLKILDSAEVLPEGFDVQTELDQLESEAPVMAVLPPLSKKPKE